MVNHRCTQYIPERTYLRRRSREAPAATRHPHRNVAFSIPTPVEFPPRELAGARGRPGLPERGHRLEQRERGRRHGRVSRRDHRHDRLKSEDTILQVDFGVSQIQRTIEMIPHMGQV